MRILFIDSNHPLLHETLERAGHTCDLHYHLTKEEIIANVHLYDGIVIRSRIKITKEIIDKAVRLKFIARAGAGMENIDVEYAESKGIRCLHAPEGNRDAVGEHALGTIFLPGPDAGADIVDDRQIGQRGTHALGDAMGKIRAVDDEHDVGFCRNDRRGRLPDAGNQLRQLRQNLRNAHDGKFGEIEERCQSLALQPFAADTDKFDRPRMKLPQSDNEIGAQEIAGDRRFPNLTAIWLNGDHYKWRAMRANGIHERFITGDAPDPEKFDQWAATVPYTWRNPLFHWTHLELKRYFQIDRMLNRS